MRYIINDIWEMIIVAETVVSVELKINCCYYKKCKRLDWRTLGVWKKLQKIIIHNFYDEGKGAGRVVV